MNENTVEESIDLRDDLGSDFSPNTETKEVSGILEILQDFGFLR